MAKETFEKNLSRLEEIVARLEEGDAPLDESIKLFEEGVKLSRRCSEKLNSAEKKIEILLKDDEGKAIKEPFEPQKK